MSNIGEFIMILLAVVFVGISLFGIATTFTEGTIPDPFRATIIKEGRFCIGETVSGVKFEKCYKVTEEKL